MELVDCACCGGGDGLKQVESQARWAKFFQYFSQEDCQERVTLLSYLCENCWDEADLDSIDTDLTGDGNVARL